MGAMDLDAVEACLLSADCGGHKVFYQRMDFGCRQGARAGLLIHRGAYRCCLDQVSGGSHARVMQLQYGNTIVSFDLCRQSGKTRQVLVAEHTELARETLADGLHMGSAGHGETKPAPGAQGKPLKLLVRKHAIVVTLQVCEGRQHEAVLHVRAVTEAQGFEQFAHWDFLDLENGNTSGWFGCDTKAILTPMVSRGELDVF